MSRRNHRSDHHSIQKIAVFGVATVVSAGLFVFGMIQNGKNAVQHFETLKAVDQAGGDVDAALNDLRGYIYAHMNTEIGGPNGIYPPIQLKGTYERLVAAEEQRVQDTNDKLYPEAQTYCEANGGQGFSGRNRLDCINEYIDKNGAKHREVEDSFYKYDFVAPLWSPDLAGFSLAAVVLFCTITVFHILNYWRTKHIVHVAN